MATETVEEVLVRFGADIKELQDGMKKAQALTKSGVAGIMKYLGPLATAFAGKKIFSNYTQLSNDLGNLGRSIGENVSDLDAWGEAVKHEGGSIDGFSSSIRNLAANIGQLAATGEGRAKKFFKTLNISAKDAQGNVRKASDVLLDLAQKAEKLDKAEFLGIASKLGLDDSTIRLLQKGNKSVKESIELLRQRAITDEDVNIVADYNDSIQDLMKAFQALASRILRLIVPAFKTVANGFIVVFDTIRANKGLAIGFFTLLISLIGVKLVGAIKAFGLAWTTNPATIMITAIIAGITALILTIQDLYTWMTGGDSYFGEFFGPFDEWVASASATFNAFIDSFVNSWVRARAAVDAFWQGVVDSIIIGLISASDGVENGVKTLLQKVPSWLLPDSLSDWSNSVDTGPPAPPNGVAPESMPGTMLGQPAGAVTNTEISTNINTVEIKVENGDPDTIASSIQPALERATIRNMSLQAARANVL